MSAQYFAQIDENNVVIDMAVTTTDFMTENPDRYPGTWIETFLDKPGKTYAGVEYTYDPNINDFIEPKVVLP